MTTTTISTLFGPLSAPKIPNHHTKSPIQFCPKPFLLTHRRLNPHRTVVLSSNPNGNGNSFLDENGAVEDMDAYLNHLSLEYDSVWDTKPSWCQPWTITLTGVAIIGLSWVILHSVVVTAAILSLICAWWYIFLFSYPKAYSDMIAERRSKVTTGIEDTFGSKKST